MRLDSPCVLDTGHFAANTHMYVVIIYLINLDDHELPYVMGILAWTFLDCGYINYLHRNRNSQFEKISYYGT